MKIVIDETANETLREKGFVKIPFLLKEELAALQDLATDFFEGKTISKFYSSHNKNTAEVNLQISQAIEEITGPALQRTFENYKFFIAHFIVKQAHNENVFHLHQDWNIVEEDEYPSIQIWIPLQDANQQNGGMFFLERSHQYFHNYRSSTFGIPNIPISGALKEHVLPVDVFATEAALFNNRILHGSYPNLTSKNRLSVLINIVAKDAPIHFHHYSKQTAQTDLYKLTAAELLTHLVELEKGNISALSFDKSVPLPKDMTDDISETEILKRISYLAMNR
jgi:ectoine hydroxylase-related dioxygenase (phytanoyl-CoA dioxygenase family)